MPRTKLNGWMLHYQQLGQGPDVVMIHGLCSSLAFWYMSVLPALAGDFRVTVYDLRGHGFSEMPPSGYTSAELAGDLDALLRHLGIDRAHLVGHSYGGAVTFSYALSHPERVASLTAADAHLPCFQPPQRRERLAQQHRPGAHDPLPGGRSRTEGQWRRLMATTSAAADSRRPAGLTARRLRDVLAPTLAIFGERSNCLPSLRGLQASLARCQTVIVPGAGHFHPLLQSDSFVDTIRGFITAQSPERIRESR